MTQTNALFKSGDTSHSLTIESILYDGMIQGLDFYRNSIKRSIESIEQTQSVNTIEGLAHLNEDEAESVLNFYNDQLVSVEGFISQLQTQDCLSQIFDLSNAAYKLSLIHI